MRNELPELKEKDEEDSRFKHLYEPSPTDYNLVIEYPKPILSKKQSVDYLKKLGIL
jgi:hypothetical protein